MNSKDLLRSCQSLKLGPETFISFDFELDSHRVAILSESLYGSGLNKTVSTTLKMAVLAPMPKARVKIATAAKPGFFNSSRMLKRRSSFRLSILSFLFRNNTQCRILYVRFRNKLTHEFRG